MKYLLFVILLSIFLIQSCKQEIPEGLDDLILDILLDDVDSQQAMIENLNENDPRLGLFSGMLSQQVALPVQESIGYKMHELRRNLADGIDMELSGTVLNSLEIQSNDLSGEIQKWQLFFLHQQYLAKSTNDYFPNYDKINELLHKDWPSIQLNIYFKNQLVHLLNDFYAKNEQIESIILLDNYLLAYLIFVNSSLYDKIQFSTRSHMLAFMYKQNTPNIYGDKILFELDQLEKAKDYNLQIDKSYIITKANLYLDSSQLEEAYKILDVDERNFSSRSMQNFYQSLGVFNFIQGNSFKEYFIKAANYSPENSCSERIITPLNFLLDAANSRSEFDSIQSIIETKFDCPINAPFFKYRNLMFRIPHPFLNYSHQEKIELFLEQRNWAYEMNDFNINTHFQDLLALNTLEILVQINALPSNQQHQYSNRIMSLFSETKNITLKNHRSKTKVETKAIPARVQEILSLTNDGLDTAYDAHPIYLELENYLFSEPEKEDKVAKDEVMQLHDYDIPAEVGVLEFLKHGNSYWSYYYQDGKIELHSSNATIVDSLIQVYLSSILEKKDLQVLKRSLKQEILPYTFDKGRLLIIPDGEMNNLPFDLLLEENVYVDYHFSVDEYLEFSETTISDPNIELLSYSNDQTIQSTSKRSYSELPVGWTEIQSIDTILRGYSSTIITGSEYNKAQVVSSNADILHFSTHASFQGDNRLSNFLLARDEIQKASPIYSYEIETMENKPDVVILSACDTGGGKHIVGAGTYSMSRSFFYAGAQTVVKSLWPVNEKASKLLMESMYKNWVKGQSLKASLKAAKDEIRSLSKYNHPFYWGGFVIEGNSKVFIEN